MFWILPVTDVADGRRWCQKRQGVMVGSSRTGEYVADFERRERRIDVVEYLALAEAIGFDPLTLLAKVMKG